MCDIGAVFERLQRYQTLAPQSARLRRTLSRIFAEFLEFSHDTRNVFRKKKSSKHKALENFLSIACSKEVLTFYLHWLEVFDRTSLKVLRSKLWTDYNGEADKRVLNIKGLCDDAEREAHLAVAEQSFQRGKEATAFYRDVRDVTSKQGPSFLTSYCIEPNAKIANVYYREKEWPRYRGGRATSDEADRRVAGASPC